MPNNKNIVKLMLSKRKWQFCTPKYWPTWLGLGLLRVISSLPWPWVAGLSDALGALIYHCYGSRRRIAQKNLQTCFPDWSEQKVSKTAKRSFQLAVQAVFWTAFGWWASPERYKKLMSCDESILEYHEQQGQNIVLLAPHFAGLEIGGMYLSQSRWMITMYQYAKNALMDHFVLTHRPRFGGDLFERKAPLRNLLKMIRQGKPFYYLPDQDSGRGGQFVPFFGVQAKTFDMLGKFAQMGKAVVIPCATEILPHGQGIRIHLQEALTDYPSGDDTKDTAFMNEVIEQMIRQRPEQYLWAHKRFKTRPEGEPAFY